MVDRGTGERKMTHMKRVLKYVYYCDHCNKRSLSGGHISTHEKHCTANPERECRICGRKGISDIVEAFKTRFSLIQNYPQLAGPVKESPEFTFDDFEMAFVGLPDGVDHSDSHRVVWNGEPVKFEEVEDTTEGCPCCILAVLRQTGFNRHYFHFPKYDFQADLREYRLNQEPPRHKYEY